MKAKLEELVEFENYFHMQFWLVGPVRGNYFNAKKSDLGTILAAFT